MEYPFEMVVTFREYVNPVFNMSINYFPGVLENFIGLEHTILIRVIAIKTSLFYFQCVCFFQETNTCGI